jgi:colicin import membrane protein
MSEIIEYNATEAALSELRGFYKHAVYDVSTKDGMDGAKAARNELRSYRTSLDKVRKEIKEPALRRCQMIDSEAKRITAELSALEDPIAAQITEQERKVQEKDRVIREASEKLRLQEEAKRKAEEEKIAAERAELDKQRAELAAKEKAAQDKIEYEQREARLKIEEEQREARLKIEEEQRAARMAIEESEREARLKREAEEATERETLRKQMEITDGYNYLQMFVDKYGSVEEFNAISTTIKDFLNYE